MERIFKIKTKTDKLPRSPYPSERRYSASMVIGLSVVFLQLFFYSILMGTLVVHKMTLQPYQNNTNQNNTEETTTASEIANLTEAEPNNSTGIQLEILKLYEKVDKDIDIILQQNKDLNNMLKRNYVNISVLICSGCFSMALGYILAFALGVLAWKQWYIDHNITFFFLASAFSSLTAAVGLLFSVLTCINLDYDYDTYTYEVNRVTPITFSLAMNVTILSTIGLIWSLLASKISYAGMKSAYPDDLVFNKGGRHVEISTEQKGSKKCIFPQDIIEHFPTDDKLAKYLPKKHRGNLPKHESKLEFQQRVNKFLAEVPENSVKNC